MTTTPTLDEELSLSPSEVATRDRFEQLVARLSHQSVVKHYDAYADIPWDDPAYAIDPDDPRWELSRAADPLGATGWYQSQPPGVRSRIGLYRYASAMKIGLEFENILKRGLLEFAFGLRNGDPTFRYAYHEVIEEAHHGLMFQEFVNRAGFDVPGIGRRERLLSRRIVRLGRTFPELFFLFVIGGEDPIDHLQRETLRQRSELHPLFETIMRHHVTEEARHLSFARHYLKMRVPQLSPLRRFRLSIAAPTILGEMAKLMMQAPHDLIREFGVPEAVVREAYTDNPEHRRQTQEALRKVRRLCRETGLINPVSRWIWQRRGIWADD
ncbi:AurF N-oxygenase family protein [Rhabdothermincola sp.]|uniref:AurF N-oxygenase family protein n=1 Tax=Rhabdothermincola sp. TaxID=2820405 RepID=UPI002FE08ADB